MGDAEGMIFSNEVEFTPAEERYRAIRKSANDFLMVIIANTRDSHIHDKIVSNIFEVLTLARASLNIEETFKETTWSENR